MADAVDTLGAEFLDGLDEALARLVTESTRLRETVADRLGVEDPASLHSSLLECRRAIDRTIGILAALTRARGRVQEVREGRQAAVDDAWNAAATNTRTSFVHADAAPRERYARYSLATFDEQRALRAAERTCRDVDTALEVVRLNLRGLEGTSRDINSFIYAMKVEGRLET